MSWSRRQFGAGLTLGLIGLSGCGFEPLYSEGSEARGLRSNISIGEVPGRFGFELRQRLETRLGATASPRYRLEIETARELSERAIRSDNTITRFTIEATARFVVIDTQTGDPVFQDSAKAFTAYSAVASAFATRAAEEDANNRVAEALADQIVLRLSASAQDWIS